MCFQMHSQLHPTEGYQRSKGMELLEVNKILSLYHKNNQLPHRMVEEFILTPTICTACSVNGSHPLVESAPYQSHFTSL